MLVRNWAMPAATSPCSANAQQDLARKVQFSNGWKKAKMVVTRLYQRVVNKRRDWFFKLAHTLTDRYDYLFFEDLSMKGA
jgi:putative transposase